MSKASFIYRNIHFYRMVMNLLYKGNYSKRFEHISKHITGKDVTEICFGDLVIADYCFKNKINWIGLDINEYFVEKALKKGYQAQSGDIEILPELPEGDTCIISGSLYHFHENLEPLFTKMLQCAPK